MILRCLAVLAMATFIKGASIKMVKDFHGNTPSNPDPCILTCVGSTGAGNTKWQGEAGRLYTYVDMTECGFVDVPIVTTSLPGKGHHDYMVGMTSPFSVTETGFSLVILGKAQTSWEIVRHPAGKDTMQTLEQATELEWNVSWNAVGYNC